MAFAASGRRMGGGSFSSPSSSSSSSYSSATYFGDSDVDVEAAFLFGVVITAIVLVVIFVVAEKTSVVKIQVGLLGVAKSLQGDLNQIAEVADTSSPEGLHLVLTKTILALLRHPSYCISACSSVDVKRSIEEGEKRFNQFSIEERGKFDEETLVNVNNIRKQTATAQRTNIKSNEYIVITILVAVRGLYKLPAINSSGDLKDALQKLASIPSSRTQWQLKFYGLFKMKTTHYQSAKCSKITRYCSRYECS